MVSGLRLWLGGLFAAIGERVAPDTCGPGVRSSLLEIPPGADVMIERFEVRASFRLFRPAFFRLSSFCATKMSAFVCVAMNIRSVVSSNACIGRWVVSGQEHMWLFQAILVAFAPHLFIFADHLLPAGVLPLMNWGDPFVAFTGAQKY